MFLAGDIGGTKTNLAVYSPQTGPREPVVETTFSSKEYDSLEDVTQEFLTGIDLRVDRAVFGVAGPVMGRQATITNLPWKMSEPQLQAALHIPSVHLINDLAAIAHAIPFLTPNDLHVLVQGEAIPGDTKAVVAPGTGLGEAYLTWDGSQYRVHPSEGGHCDFAPTTTLELDMLRFLLERFEHVSYETVCSGSGLPNIYKYLKHSGIEKEPDWLASQLAETSDKTPVIITAAKDKAKACPLCQATLDTFVSILGAEAGNLALKVMAYGGVYLAGGIPPRILSSLEEGQFWTAFRRKGRLSPVLDNIPVFVVLNPKAALLGAACHALSLEQSPHGTT